jgi:hypothetical protein
MVATVSDDPKDDVSAIIVVDISARPHLFAVPLKFRSRSIRTPNRRMGLVRLAQNAPCYV